MLISVPTVHRLPHGALGIGPGQPLGGEPTDRLGLPTAARAQRGPRPLLRFPAAPGARGSLLRPVSARGSPRAAVRACPLRGRPLLPGHAAAWAGQLVGVATLCPTCGQDVPGERRGIHRQRVAHCLYTELSRWVSEGGGAASRKTPWCRFPTGTRNRPIPELYLRWHGHAYCESTAKLSWLFHHYLNYRNSVSTSVDYLKEKMTYFTYYLLLVVSHITMYWWTWKNFNLKISYLKKYYSWAE